MAILAHRIGGRFASSFAAVLLTATPTFAGPPYLTDDPQPTDLGRWEIYNFATGAKTADGVDGEAGLDLNYGAAKDLQLTAVLPLAFSDPNGFSTSGFHAGTGTVELAAKYKVLHAAENSWRPDVSIFPRLFAPTNQHYGTGHLSLLLPVWVEKDLGPWQAFGGGGYQINPGPSQRNYWQGGVALNRIITDRLQLGGEVFSQTRNAVDGPGYTALNAALTYKLVEHWFLLASAGPTLRQGGGHGQVFYFSLKADY